MNEDEDIVIDEENMFQYNELRGCSFIYSYLAVETFLKNNNLLSVIRAHEAQDHGYKLYKADPVTQFPMIICIFSAPNYCDAYRLKFLFLTYEGNKAAIIKFENNMMNVKQFTQVPHPYFLPNFMNVFQWSIPFVGEKVSHMFQFLVDYSEELEEKGEKNNVTIDQDKAESIKTKVLTLGRIANMYSTLRKEQELILQLKGLTGGHIPQGSF
jgi:serine/threonine-protein phosphatase 2B catalytic subunit